MNTYVVNAFRMSHLDTSNATLDEWTQPRIALNVRRPGFSRQVRCVKGLA